MNFTFGIITNGTSDDSVNQVIDSIESQNIPEYQIIIVGNTGVQRSDTFIIPFDESIKDGWITRKKNLITINAFYDNIVYTHDYVVFEPGWYEGFVKFGDDFKVCMNKFVNPDDSRFRDWVIWPHNGNFMDDIVLPNRECLIPYDMTHLSKYQYISGTYWVAKKDVMMEFPLDENLLWGQDEDVIWSKQVREKYNFSMNPYSTVRSLKFKHPAFNISGKLTNEKLLQVKNMIIHCIGDSHSAVFSGEETMQPCWPEPASNTLPYFKSYRIGPATAYQIANKQPLIESVIDSLELGENDKLMFCFGEVDCRAHLIKQSKIQNRPVNDLVVECVNRYINAITYYKKYGVKIIVWGPIASWNEEKVYVGPSFGTNQERNWVTFAFNVALQIACLKEGFEFVSIFYNMVDDNMITNPDFLDDWTGSHMHLSQRAMPTIIKAFEKRGLI